jgi:hypothetical protein
LLNIAFAGIKHYAPFAAHWIRKKSVKVKLYRGTGKTEDVARNIHAKGVFGARLIR